MLKRSCVWLDGQDVRQLLISSARLLTSILWIYPIIKLTLSEAQKENNQVIKTLHLQAWCIIAVILFDIHCLDLWVKSVNVLACVCMCTCRCLNCVCVCVCFPGDFFKDALPDADLYILARILHDWSDQCCIQLLRRVYQAGRPGLCVWLWSCLWVWPWWVIYFTPHSPAGKKTADCIPQCSWSQGKKKRVCPSDFDQRQMGAQKQQMVLRGRKLSPVVFIFLSAYLWLHVCVQGCRCVCVLCA